MIEESSASPAVSGSGANHAATVPTATAIPGSQAPAGSAAPAAAERTTKPRRQRRHPVAAPIAVPQEAQAVEQRSVAAPLVKPIRSGRTSRSRSPSSRTSSVAASRAATKAAVTVEDLLVAKKMVEQFGSSARAMAALEALRKLTE
jgi:hypothetical protein